MYYTTNFLKTKVPVSFFVDVRLHSYLNGVAPTLYHDSNAYPIDTIAVGKVYNVDFDNRGYLWPLDSLRSNRGISHLQSDRFRFVERKGRTSIRHSV